MTLPLRYTPYKPMIIALGFTSTVLCSLKTSADENRLDWSVYSEVEYDSNNQLRSEDELSLTGTRLQSDIAYSKRSATDKLSTELSAYSERFNRSEYDFEGYLFDGTYDWTGETNSLYFDIGSKRQSTQVSEQTDTGRITNEASYRQENNISLLWQKQFSQQHALYLNTNAGDVDYESQQFADYQNWTVALGLQYQFNALTTWRLQTDYERYESTFIQEAGALRQTTEVDAKTTSYQLALNRQLSETFSFDLSAGQSLTDNHITQSSNFLSQVIESQSDGDLLILSTSAKYSGENNTASLEWSRNTQGSGSGSITEVNEASFRYKHTLSNTSALNMHLQYIEREDFIESLSESTRQSREFYRLTLGFDKKVSEKLVTHANLGYRTQKVSDSGERPDAYSLDFSLHYIPYSTLW